MSADEPRDVVWVVYTEGFRDPTDVVAWREDGDTLDNETAHRYVAVDALLSSEAKKAAGRALAAQLAGSHESGSFADVYEEAAIVLRAAIDALGAA